MISNGCLTLEELSTELLIKIFSYLELNDLCHLKQTNKRFKEIITTWDNVFFKDFPVPIVTNQISEQFLSKCIRKLTHLEKIRISLNWIKAKYSEESLLFNTKKSYPFLHLSTRYLWASRGTEVSCYERNYSGRAMYVLKGESDADIVNFQLRNDLMVSGLRDGTIWLKNINDNNAKFKIQDCHSSDVNSVDLSKDKCTVVSGTRDGELKLWKISERNTVESIVTLQCQDLIWKVAFSENNQLAVGTAGNKYHSSIFVYDIDRITSPVELVTDNAIGGVLDIRWDGSHTLWTCGSDAFLRRWDLRTGKCEQSFLDPSHSVVYCLDYDYQNTIMTGAQVHARVMLWDIRKDSAVQIYFMESCQKKYQRSPIYSLVFDSEFLYTGTDQNINTLDFSVYKALSKDYSYFCQKRTV